MGEIQEANSADQIDQLEALRLKMKSVNSKSSSSKSEKISGNEIPGMRKAIQKGETFNKYGDAARGLGSKRSKNMDLLGGGHLSREFRTVQSLVEGRFVYTVGGISRFQQGAKNRRLC